MAIINISTSTPHFNVKLNHFNYFLYIKKKIGNNRDFIRDFNSLILTFNEHKLISKDN